MEKVMTVDTIEYVEQQRCTHIEDEACSYVMKTKFKPEEVSLI